MALRDRGILRAEHCSDGIADDVATTEDDCMCTSDRDTSRLEQSDTPSRCTRSEKRVCSTRCKVANIVRMETKREREKS